MKKANDVVKSEATKTHEAKKSEKVEKKQFQKLNKPRISGVYFFWLYWTYRLKSQ